MENNLLNLLNALAQASVSHTGRLQQTQPPNGNYVPDCPGLNHLNDSRILWTVPYGSVSSVATYCPACTHKYNLQGTLVTINSNCNCDSYMVCNHISNGVFNVSFWKMTKNIYYPGEKINNNNFTVTLTSGLELVMFINAKLKEAQYFRYRVVRERDGVQTEILNSDVSIEVDVIPSESSLINNDVGSPDRYAVFTYLNKDEEGADMLRDIPTILFSGDKLIFMFDVYLCKSHNFETDINKYYGHFIINENGSIHKELTKGTPLLRKNYSAQLETLSSNRELEIFTVKPVVMNVELRDVTGVTPDGAVAVKDAIDNIIEQAKNTKYILENKLADKKQQLNSIRTTIAELENDLAAVLTKIDSAEKYLPRRIDSNGSDNDNSSDNDIGSNIGNSNGNSSGNNSRNI